VSAGRRTRAGLAIATLVLASLLSGCGGDGGAGRDSGSSAREEDPGEGEHGAESEEEGGEREGTPATVDCPEDARAVDLPVDFSAPLPEGTVVVAVEQRSENRTVVTGVVPAAEPDVLEELQQAYPDAGLTLTEGETEERDAESNFEGEDVVGRWGIRALDGCDADATRIDVVVRPT
jgi:hypothetical protein